MTAKELIAYLGQFDPDTPILRECFEGESLTLHDIYPMEITTADQDDDLPAGTRRGAAVLIT